MNVNKRQKAFALDSTSMTGSVLADSTAKKTSDARVNFLTLTGIKKKQQLVNMRARQLYVVSTSTCHYIAIFKRAQKRD